MDASRSLGRAVGAVYTWAVTFYFGAVLLDVVYSRLINGSLGTATQGALNEVSDLLLMIEAFALVAGLVAIGLSWGVPVARNLFFTSLVVVLLPTLLAMMVLVPLSRTTPGASMLAYGPMIRLAPLGLGSVLGFLALGSLPGAGTAHPPAA